MRVAYLINQYPMVSHSFIRREIHALETLGVFISRLAIRGPRDGELCDDKDKAEFAKCFILTNCSKIFIFKTIVRALIHYPKGFIKALGLVLAPNYSFLGKFALGSAAGPNLLRRIICLFEALVFAEQIRRERVQHLHAHFGTNSAAIALLIHKLTKTGYSFTVHGPEEFDHTSELGLKKKIKHASFVAAISNFGRSQLLRLNPDDTDKIKVIRCGIGTRFKSAATSPVPDSNHFVCVGRLCTDKAQIHLVKIIYQLVQKGLDITLTLAGDGPERENIEHLIHRLNLQDKVTITGWLSPDEIQALIHRSRAFILLSFAEGLPVVLMEAMALARPVIATYIAGIPELIQHGENGFLVPAGDMERAGDIIEHVLRLDPQRLNEIGGHARRSALAQHDSLREAEKLKQLFEDAVGART